MASNLDTAFTTRRKKKTEPVEETVAVAETEKEISKPEQVTAVTEEVKEPETVAAEAPVETVEPAKKQTKAKKETPKPKVAIAEEKPPIKEKKRPEGIKASKEKIETFEDVDISDDLIEEVTKEDKRQEELYQKLLEYKEHGNVVYGSVFGVDSDSTYSKAIIKVVWNGIVILVPDTAYFEPSWHFPAGYEHLSEEGKMTSRVMSARETIGALCPVVIKGVGKNINEEGEEQITVFGSRTDALAVRRDKYFLHKNTDDPREVKINSVAKANVVYVNKDFITVECLGVETRMDCYNLSENEVVTNCTDFYKPGDVINVRVKKIRFEGNSVYLAVTGLLNNSSQAVKTIKEQGSYFGHVRSYNKLKDIYTVVLKNGAKASVHSNGVYNHVAINPGDRVCVHVLEVKEDYVIGIARKV